MVHKLFYFYTLKGLINRLKFFPLKAVLTFVLVCTAVFAPVFILNQNFKLDIKEKYLEILFSFYFAYIFLQVFLGRGDFKRVPQNFTSILNFVPDKSLVLYKVLVLDTLLKSSLSYGVLYVILWSYSKSGAINLLIGLLLVFMAISIPVLLSAIVSILSAKKMSLAIKSISLFISVLLIFNGILIYFKDLRNGILAWLPNYVFADTLNALLGMEAANDFTKIFLRLLVLLAVTVLLYYLIFIRSNLMAHSIYEKSKKLGNNINSERYTKVRRFLIIPAKMNVLTAKELVQIWDEKSQLITALWQTLAASVIMIVTSKTIESNALIIGFIVSLCYSSFLISVFSIPRETKSLWILKSIYPSWKVIVASKFIGCYIASIIANIFVYVFYAALTYLVVGVSPAEFINPFIWCIYTAIPGSAALGFLISSFIPYDIVDKKKSVTYKFSGLEGIILVILIFTMAVPATLAGGFLKFDDMILRLIFLIYVLLILMLAYFSSKRKLKNII